MRDTSFNIVQLSVAIIVGLAGLCLVAACSDVDLEGLGDTGDTKVDTEKARAQNSTNARKIHQALVTYGNSNKEWYPGINSAGEDDGLDVEARYWRLIEADLIDEQYLLSPTEDEKSFASSTNKHYSYAMLQVPKEGGRREEWNSSLNSLAVVITDRNVGSASSPQSIHNDAEGAWIGTVLWNDNHVDFEEKHTGFATSYGRGDLNGTGMKTGTDNLFRNDKTPKGLDNHDALMVHEGN